MPERGGPTTQAGIVYQNTVAALYLGRMLDGQPRRDRERVVAVRVEAPTEVDDTVVEFADDHCVFIQAKIVVRVGDDAWDTLWEHISRQFASSEFRRGFDRIHLQLGSEIDKIKDLEGICERAISSTSYAEWRERLTNAQRTLLNKIQPLLHSQGTDSATFLALFKDIEVVIATQSQLDHDYVPHWIPSSNFTPTALFRLLRDRVAGESRIRRRFTEEDLRRELEQTEKVQIRGAVSLEALSNAVKQCGAQLHAHPIEFGATGCHVRRPVVDDIVTWLSDTDRVGSLAILTDQAGMGKTVVLHDTLVALEQCGMPVLAIKADLQCSGITSYEAMAGRLQLPDSVERIVAALSANCVVAVLIDQVDALSLSMAHDQQALNTLLDLVAGLRILPRVAVLLSCRTFDRSSDPRLRALRIDRTFVTRELDDAQVKDVVESLGVVYTSMAPATCTLLRVPLHLHLFAQLPHGESDPIPGREIASLQDLYALLWRHVILVPLPNGPSEADRSRAIGVLTDHMHRAQRTSVPQSLFLNSTYAPLMAAVRWLASTGILVPGRDSWAFLHQTFFDYCYALRFVEEGRQLAAEIRSGDQGFFVRPLLTQVLAYLRGVDMDSYLSLDFAR